MSNLSIYNQDNSQEITLIGLVDITGARVSAPSITGAVQRKGATLTGGTITFSPVSGTPGNYTGMLEAFDAVPGGASLVITGTNGGDTFKFTLYATIEQRSL